ncbi:MAG TPA: hypothetical protein ENI61_00480 [Ignavibacteria bacterium]|nr:hypothetical protein [Ignavibacteria bacterium]
MNPDDISLSLKYAAIVAGSGEKSKTRSALRRAYASTRSSFIEHVVYLAGPFREADSSNTSMQDTVEFVDESLTLKNLEFAEMVARRNGISGILTHEDLENMEDMYHNVILKLDFAHWGSELPSNKEDQGSNLVSWDLVSIDGIVLENPKDKISVQSVLEEYVKNHRAEWEDWENMEQGYTAP